MTELDHITIWLNKKYNDKCTLSKYEKDGIHIKNILDINDFSKYYFTKDYDFIFDEPLYCKPTELYMNNTGKIIKKFSFPVSSNFYAVHTLYNDLITMCIKKSMFTPVIEKDTEKNIMTIKYNKQNLLFNKKLKFEFYKFCWIYSNNN